MKIWLNLKAELFEIALRRRRYLLYLLIAGLTAVIAGSLASVTPPIRVILFSNGFTAETPTPTAVMDALKLIGKIEVVEEKTEIDPESIRRNNAAIGLGLRNGRSVVVINTTTPLRADLGYFALAAQRTLEQYAPPQDAIGLIKDRSAWPERLSFLPRSERWIFVPRVIALLSIFASFLLSFEGYARSFSSCRLHVQIAASGGSFGPYVTAKLLTATFGGISTLLFLLLAVNGLFGIAPHRGAIEVIGVYLIGCATSASLGLSLAMIFGSSRQVLGIIAAYFFALICFSGFILPLASAEDFVQWGSFALPLRYPLAILDQWLVNGQPPTSVGITEFLNFIALAISSLALLLIAIRAARTRL